MLITILLSIINLAGIARTDVAVGTESEASILATTRAPTPRIGSSVAAPGVARVGIGFAAGCAGVAGAVATVRTTGCDTGAAGAATTGAACAGATGAAAGVAGVPPIEIFGGVTGFGVGGVPPFGAPATGALEPGEAACGLFWK
ncbi:unannotated protein [freshwater metagenome]|uniref:Unannotated protein n=1 Tax=freshwater metagenome TaxID=449393 RepID=A0A6J6TJE9_9ZZZZ